ncbi:GAF domain-containing SpoIIE family protein phosphatase [Actinomadura sp. HBU206391]|uniref:GAF domain-containing SpoIIE family protein phosphatase n=1 Tax=Actinomadura sp. HBU206391 TaxID=2731692 RepID=UPI0016501D72|nr:GAF domain-containing SpoIIE family protein phosphatase [Actinomadura sp. HBU206391]MBC6457223.1 SpoIIE family protein phosphatase [Actinomadura sp. HBU206391]
MYEDRLSDAEQAIWQAQPHAVAGTALDVIAGHFPVTGAEIYLSDYRMAFLIPVSAGGEPIRMDNTPIGRAFAAQQTITEAATAPEDRPHRAHQTHVPLSVHGDRLGVLSIFSAGEIADDDLRQLTSLAHMIARALKIAESGTDVYRRLRRRSRLTLAAEMQWDLLPGRSCACAEYNLAGQLEPAYDVWGDNYDWSATADRLIVTVSNGMGKGTQAALLTNLAISAMRNARRSGAGLVDQATLANEMIYSHHGGEINVATLLLEFEIATGRVRAIDAGSPLMWRLRGNDVGPIELEAQLPLGLFPDTEYTVQEFTVEPGDRLIIVSDGVHTALSPAGEAYGNLALPKALRRTRLLDPPEAVRSLTRGLLDYHEGGELLDDAVILCLDWTGKKSAHSE